VVLEVCLEWALLSPGLWDDLSVTSSVDKTSDESVLKAEINLIIASYF